MNAFDMGQFIAPKSDQLNADDLIAGPMTITVTRVSGNEGSPEQPVNVFFDGDDGKPYRPCKSMRRVMVAVWGPDAAKYVGRSMTIYRDPGVQFGGMKVGGVRISHMSHIPADKMDGNGRVQMSLTTTRAKRAPYVVQELKAPVAPKADPAEQWEGWTAKFIAAVERAPDRAAVDALAAKHRAKLDELAERFPEIHTRAQAAIDAVADAPADELEADELD